MKSVKLAACLLVGAIVVGSSAIAQPFSQPISANAEINNSSGVVIDGIKYRQEGTYSLLGFLPEDKDKDFIVVDSCQDKTLKNVVIPSTVVGVVPYDNVEKEMPVKRIYGIAFQNMTNLESIVLPETLEYINKGAFNGCKNLTEINIPDSVTTIETRAFTLTGISGEVVLPKSLETLEIYAFSGSPIESFSISDENENFSTEDGVIYNKDKTKLIVYPHSAKRTVFTAPETVEEITGGSFVFCTNVEDVILPETVKKIDSACFERSEIKNLVIKNPECEIVALSSNGKDITLPPDAVIYAPDDSKVQKYALDNGYIFKPLSEYGGEEQTTAVPLGVTLLGDANCDGAVNIADATAIVQSIANGDKYGLTAQGAKNADCCDVGDGVTGNDAVSIQKLEAGIIKGLPDKTK